MYYIYRHIRTDENQVFYVGLGTKDIRETSFSKIYRRAFSKQKRNNFWKNIINKTSYNVEIIFESNDLSFIRQKETEFINLYGRRNLGKGSLVNLTDGGELNNNIVFSEEQKEKIRQYNLGLVHPEWRNQIKSKSQGGDNHWTKKKNFSNEAKINMSNAHKKLRDNGYITAISKAIIELDSNGNTINEWSSLRKAGIYYNVDGMTISNIIKGQKSRKLPNKTFKYK